MLQNSNNIQTVCITGGAGFIGSHLARQLLAAGKKVVVLDNFSVGLRANIPTDADIIEGDILDAEVAKAATQYDAIIHLAARVAIRSSFEHIVQDTHTNVVGTATLLNALGSNPGNVKKFLLASSMAVYSEGSADAAIKETHPIKPLSPYGTSKYAAELLVQQACARVGVDAGILRLFNTYGNGQALSPYVGVVTIFANAIKAGTTPQIFGSGEQCRDFVHADDIAQGFTKALSHQNNGQVYNLGSGVGLSVNQVYAAIANALGWKAAPVYAAKVPGEMQYSVADISKAKNLLGYLPQHNFVESIASIVHQI